VLDASDYFRLGPKIHRIQSDIDAEHAAFQEGSEFKWNLCFRPRRYAGDPPPNRLRLAALRHECRARRHGVRYDLLDLRLVFSRAEGVCGICRLPVGFDEFVVDHIVPMWKGGPHLFENVQPAHHACNTRKGNR
jgi:5-methylcytosine-specific restriction endonuclease McrA